jgi:hypothetical protein
MEESVPALADLLEAAMTSTDLLEATMTSANVVEVILNLVDMVEVIKLYKLRGGWVQLVRMQLSS